MYNGQQAYDTATGEDLDSETAMCAADNPMLYRWVGWR